MKLLYEKDQKTRINSNYTEEFEIERKDQFYQIQMENINR